MRPAPRTSRSLAISHSPSVTLTTLPPHSVYVPRSCAVCVGTHARAVARLDFRNAEAYPLRPLRRHAPARALSCSDRNTQCVECSQLSFFPPPLTPARSSRVARRCPPASSSRSLPYPLRSSATLGARFTVPLRVLRALRATLYQCGGRDLCCVCV